MRKEPSTIEDPLLGETLDGRFRLEGLLGAGGMGQVYLGRQLSVDRRVAIKVVRADRQSEDRTRRRFLREAEVLADLSHPSLVRMIDFGVDDERDLPYLVMEKVGGLPLSELLERGKLRIELIVAIAKQVCAGLAAAHAAGVIHRDLKPDNIHLMASADGSLRVKVLDFGIALPVDTDERLTRTGDIHGTPQYMAPEQASGEEAVAGTDLYAVGIILFQMLTGALPFDGDSSVSVVMKHVKEPVPRLDDYIDTSYLPTGMVGLVESMLAKRPGGRPESAREVRQRFQLFERRAGYQPVEVHGDVSIDAAVEQWVIGATRRAHAVDDSTKVRRDSGLASVLATTSTESLSRALLVLAGLAALLLVVVAYAIQQSGGLGVLTGEGASAAEQKEAGVRAPAPDGGATTSGVHKREASADTSDDAAVAVEENRERPDTGPAEAVKDERNAAGGGSVEGESERSAGTVREAKPTPPPSREPADNGETPAGSPPTKTGESKADGQNESDKLEESMDWVTDDYE